MSKLEELEAVEGTEEASAAGVCWQTAEGGQGQEQKLGALGVTLSPANCLPV